MITISHLLFTRGSFRSLPLRLKQIASIPRAAIELNTLPRIPKLSAQFSTTGFVFSPKRKMQVISKNVGNAMSGTVSCLATDGWIGVAKGRRWSVSFCFILLFCFFESAVSISVCRLVVKIVHAASSCVWKTSMSHALRLLNVHLFVHTHNVTASHHAQLRSFTIALFWFWIWCCPVPCWALRSDKTLGASVILAGYCCSWAIEF